MPSPDSPGRPAAQAALPGGVIALGFVSLAMDASTETINSLLPVFLVSVLGASALAVGIIEGVAESTAALAKVFSGVVSDWTGRRKPLVLLGYGLAALSKPLFPLATGVSAVLAARFIDRIGKGIRVAPRDALLADVTPPELRGAAYGLRQAMDSAGAFAGPAIGLALMAWTHDNYRFVFWAAVVPAFVAVALILFGVSETERRPSPEKRRFPIRREEMKRLSAEYWRVVALASFLTLARFSQAFLLLRASGVGLAATFVPAILIVMNVVYSASAYPFGKLADRVRKQTLLSAGIVFLIGADLVLAAAGAVWMAVAGAVLWGLHMGATQGLLSALVADTSPEDLRGSAFGLFNLATGVAVLGASVLAGALWTELGPAATFLGGAGLAAVALLGILAEARRRT
jgi:MFS family permease